MDYDGAISLSMLFGMWLRLRYDLVRAKQMKPMKPNEMLKALRKSKSQIIKYAKSLPDQDAYCEVFSICASIINAIDDTLLDVPEALRHAKEDLKEHPEQMLNHAIDTCYIKGISEDRPDPTSDISLVESDTNSNMIGQNSAH